MPPIRAILSRIQQTVTPDTIRQQAFMAGSALVSYSVLAPAVRGLITGQYGWLTATQIALTAGLTVLASVAPVYYLIPLGHRLQNRPDPRQNEAGRWISIGLETLYTIGFLELFGLIFRWNPWVTLGTSFWQGVTKGVPLSLIYKKWGDRPWSATVLRQGAMIAMMTNQAAVNSIVSAKGQGISPLELGEVAAFNLVLGALVALAPSQRNESR